MEGPKGSEESEQRPSRGASSSSTAAAAAAIAVVTDADYISPATDPPPPSTSPSISIRDDRVNLHFTVGHASGARLVSERINTPVDLAVKE